MTVCRARALLVKKRSPSQKGLLYSALPGNDDKSPEDCRYSSLTTLPSFLPRVLSSVWLAHRFSYLVHSVYLFFRSGCRRQHPTKPLPTVHHLRKLNVFLTKWGHQLAVSKKRHICSLKSIGTHRRNSWTASSDFSRFRTNFKSCLSIRSQWLQERKSCQLEHSDVLFWTA